jgi:protein-disulfide isomerase
MQLKRFLIITLSGLALSSATHAQTAANNVTKAELPKLVEDALMNDPKIIERVVTKLQEVKKKEEQEAAKAAVQKNRDALLKNVDNPSYGPANADVTIVEFFDYHCGYCKHFLPELTKLLDGDKKVRVVFKDFPILSEDSMTAAKAAIAFYRLNKDKFFDFHTALMKETGKFDDAKLAELVKANGVDPAKLKSEMAKPEVQKVINDNRKLGEELNIQGTPAIIVGDSLAPGAMSYEELKKLVDDTRAANKK